MTPIPGQTVSLPTRIGRAKADDYYKVLRVSGTQRHRVYLQRHGTGERRTVALSDFRRVARASPR